jgi:hypothetical protein
MEVGQGQNRGCSAKGKNWFANSNFFLFYLRAINIYICCINTKLNKVRNSKLFRFFVRGATFDCIVRTLQSLPQIVELPMRKIRPLLPHSHAAESRAASGCLNFTKKSLPDHKRCPVVTYGFLASPYKVILKHWRFWIGNFNSWNLKLVRKASGGLSSRRFKPNISLIIYRFIGH